MDGGGGVTYQISLYGHGDHASYAYVAGRTDYISLRISIVDVWWLSSLYSYLALMVHISRVFLNCAIARSLLI